MHQLHVFPTRFTATNNNMHWLILYVYINVHIHIHVYIYIYIYIYILCDIFTSCAYTTIFDKMKSTIKQILRRPKTY